MSKEHPARTAGKRSMSAAERRAREEWLSLYADDAKVEDPVGPSPMDPEGKGHKGKEALARFFDANIANTKIRFEIKDSFAAGQECANVGAINLTFPDGSTGLCEGVFVYRVNAEGKIISLRAFWEFERMMKTIKPAPKS
ncbi:MAG: nuclear transport factor 2 family protein [Chloroflexi bacterium]|nr:nuclear transport factor 2 family protein [Chloroflexota bacterium]